MAMLPSFVTIACGLLLATQDAENMLKQAAVALQRGQAQQAVTLAEKAILAQPDNATAYLLRGTAYDALGKFTEALADLDRAIALAPKNAEAYQERGCVHFKLSKFAASVRDFDKYIELRPERKVSHWQRGISYYYAGQYDEGRRQFEGYQDFDSNDVENAIWRFMCMARKDGLARARQNMLKIGNDRRVPMRQVYDLFKGDLQPDEVLAAAQAPVPLAEQRSKQLFYAHLYVGIYYDLTGERKKALEHLNRATENHRIGHYMWDVARVHRDLLQATKDKR
jgi:lipoprotein NlpI